MNKIYLSIIVFILFLIGCATVEGPITKRRYSSEGDIRYLQEVLEYGRIEYVEKHSGLSAEVKQAILEGRIRKGMSKDEVMASWGKPDIVYRTVTNNIVNEQWLYKDIDYKILERRTFYLNFKNNILDSWQD